MSALLLGLALAHDGRPALLDVTVDGARVDVTLRQGLVQGRRPPLEPRWPAGCVAEGPWRADPDLTSIARRWRLDCAGATPPRVLVLDGLERGDAVARVREGGPERVLVLRAGQHTVALDPPPTATPASPPLSTWLVMGARHVLAGADHLLFVLALALLVGPRPRHLAAAVTGFTLGHSLTLALAALALLTAPVAAVEATIAASVLLLARELARPEAAPTLVRRSPTLVAAACGLVHGLGFAGALAEVGLPADRAPEALGLFNVGVELGQLTFLAAVVGAGALAARLPPAARRWGRSGVVTAIGALSASWLLQRGLPLLR